jgi:hypothetical protein
MKGEEMIKILKSNHFSIESKDTNKGEIDILIYMQNLKDFIDYSSRQKLIKILQEAINLRIKATNIKQIEIL